MFIFCSHLLVLILWQSSEFFSTLGEFLSKSSEFSGDQIEIYPLEIKSFFIFYLYSSSIGLPNNDSTFSFGFCAIFKATRFEILVSSDQNISNYGSFETTSLPDSSVAKVSDM